MDITITHIHKRTEYTLIDKISTKTKDFHGQLTPTEHSQTQT